MFQQFISFIDNKIWISLRLFWSIMFIVNFYDLLQIDNFLSELNSKENS